MLDHGFQLEDSSIRPEWNHLTRRVLGCAIEVHKHLGPGLLERLYEEALCHELSLTGIRFERQRPLILDYKGIPLDGMKLDILVEGILVVELKSVEAVLAVHIATMLSYMRSLNAPLGLCINFNHARLMDGVYRRANTGALSPIVAPPAPPPPSSPRSSASPRSMPSQC